MFDEGCSSFWRLCWGFRLPEEIHFSTDATIGGINITQDEISAFLKAVGATEYAALADIADDVQLPLKTL